MLCIACRARDDTPVKMRAPGRKKTRTARVWTYVRDERPWSGQSPPCAWYQANQIIGRVARHGGHGVERGPERAHDRLFFLHCVVEDVSYSLQRLVFPLLDLIGVHVELLGQFSHRLLAPDGSKRDLGLKSRAVIPAWSSGHLLYSFSASSCRLRAENPIIQPVQISQATSPDLVHRRLVCLAIVATQSFSIHSRGANPPSSRRECFSTKHRLVILSSEKMSRPAGHMAHFSRG